jgi:hypothetical protein
MPDPILTAEGISPRLRNISREYGESESPFENFTAFSEISAMIISCAYPQSRLAD